MKIIYGIKKLKDFSYSSVATIGSFDGLHRGHIKIIEQLINKSKSLQIPSVIILFEPHPQEYLQKEKEKCYRILNLRDKLIILKKYKINYVICLPFNKQLSHLTAENFIKNILVNSLNVKHLIVGHDFHFGLNREGNINILKKFSAYYNFTIEEIAPIKYNNIRISSTWIRILIQHGNITLVETLINRKYILYGKVQYGNKLARTLGYPTANIHLKFNMALKGVYLVKIITELNKEHFGLANIGYRPTINGNRKILEVYIINYNENIYYKFINIIFIKKLRDEIKFFNLEELKIQIDKDLYSVRNIIK